MNVGSILRKAVSYFLFFVAMGLFFYFLLTASLYPYQRDNGADAYSETNLLSHVFLPFIYCLLSLGVGLVAQFLLLKITDAFEMRIYAICLIAFFGLYAALGIFVLVYAGTSGLIASLSCIPLFILALSEIVYGILALVGANRRLKAEKAEPNA
jgi:hypothetical protein